MMDDAKAEGLLRAYYAKRIAEVPAEAPHGKPFVCVSNPIVKLPSAARERPVASLLAFAASLAFLAGSTALSMNGRPAADMPGLVAMADLAVDGGGFDALMEGLGFVVVERGEKGDVP